MMKKAARLLCIFSVLGFTGCATLDGLGTGGFLGELNMMGTEDEVALGRRFSAEIEHTEKVMDNDSIQKYVRAMGARLASVAPRQDIAYTFKVIDAPDTVNAFALPGGYMYVYTGLMKICSNEGELAAVMAHEIAHVSARHHGEMMTRQMGMEMIGDMILGKEPGAVASLATQLFSTGITARYSRTQEREADSLGMEILYRAGYPPQAMISFMNKLLAYDQQRGGGRGLPIFATHPSPEERVMLLQQNIGKYPLRQTESDVMSSDNYEKYVLTQL